jgi:hypothetical protein
MTICLGVDSRVAGAQHNPRARPIVVLLNPSVMLQSSPNPFVMLQSSLEPFVML